MAEGSDNMAEGFRNAMTGFESRRAPRKSHQEASENLSDNLFCCLSCSDNIAESSAMFLTGF
jgi:hypothetical protein